MAPPPMPDFSRDLAGALAAACLDKKAIDIVILDVRELVTYTDYLVICSGRSDRQVKAVVEGAARATRDQDPPIRPLHMEGERSGQWALVDYGDVVLHVFQQDQRGFYDLEGLWFDAPRIDPETGEVTHIRRPDAAPANLNRG